MRLRWGLPLVADRAYNSDDLRAEMRGRGFTLIAPHRRNRRRWIVERTFAWLHGYRRVVTRFEKKAELYDGFVDLACAFIALNRLVK